jgi:hypothetical protein
MRFARFIDPDICANEEARSNSVSGHEEKVEGLSDRGSVREIFVEE